MHKLNILGGGKLEYYKPMRGTTKSGRDQILKFKWGGGWGVGGSKRGEHDF